MKVAPLQFCEVQCESDEGLPRAVDMRRRQSSGVQPALNIFCVSFETLAVVLRHLAVNLETLTIRTQRQKNNLRMNAIFLINLMRRPIFCLQ
jgi:hypothetical protein